MFKKLLKTAAVLSGTAAAMLISSVTASAVTYKAEKTADGKTYQLSGFNGCKLLGVKPQEDADKLQICDDLALFLTSEAVQIARFEAVQWGPSNLNAQATEAVQSNEALAALSEQFAFTIPQGQYAGAGI